MKIVHLIDGGGLYGAERVVLDLAAAQHTRGDVAEIVTLAPEDRSSPMMEAAHSRGIPATAFPIAAGLKVGTAFRLARSLKSLKADVFHSHGYRPDILLALSDPFSRLPRVSTVHGVTLARKTSTHHSIARWCRVTMREIAYVSRHTREKVSSLFRAGTVIFNGVNPDPFRKLRCSRLDKPSPRINLLAAGRLAPEKDFFLLLDVVGELVRQKVDCYLDLCGDGPLASDLRRHAETIGIDSRVTFSGFCDDIPQRLSASDLLIFTSITEGMPVTILEAMMLGVPVVATTVGGIPEMLEGYSVGRLVRTRSSLDLAQAVTEMAGKERLRRAEDRDLQHVESRFSSEAMAEAYAKVYEAIKSGRNTE